MDQGFDQLRYWIEKTLERHEEELRGLRNGYETALAAERKRITALEKTVSERESVINEFKESQKIDKDQSKRLLGAAGLIGGSIAALVEVLKHFI